MRTVLLLLPLLLVAATTFYADNGVTIGGEHFNVTVAGDNSALYLTGPYYSLLLRPGQCDNKDIYVVCLQSISEDRVQYYPHIYQINATITNKCGNDCVGFGQKCTATTKCGGACVHNVCQPSAPWCGDGYCDPGEQCPADCPNQTVQNTTNTTNVTVPPAVVNVSNASSNVPASTSAASKTGSSNATAPAPSPTASQNTTAPDQSASSKSAPKPAPVAAKVPGPNYVGAGMVVLIGLVVMVLWIRSRRKEKKDQPPI